MQYKKLMELTSWIKLLAYFFISAIHWTIPIYESHLLSLIVKNEDISPWLITSFMMAILLRSMFGYSRANIQSRILKDLIEKLKPLIRNKILTSKLAESETKVIFRNMNLFLDNYLDALDFIFNLMFLLFTSMYYGTRFGAWVAATLLMVMLLIPLIRHLVKKADYYYRHVQKLTNLRMGHLVGIATYRDDLQNLGLFSSPRISKLYSLFCLENKIRNLDSFYRTFEIYLKTFIRVIPALILYATLVKYDQEYSAIAAEIFWLSLPIIGATFTIPRGYASLKILPIIFNNFNLLKNQNQESNPKITLDHSWNLWEGDLADNLVVTDSIHTSDLLEKSHLYYELGAESIMKRPIALHGSNVSAGQKTRIVTIRALLLAEKLNLTLNIDRSFDSLDTLNKWRLKNLLDNWKMRGIADIRISEQSLKSLSEDKSPAIETDFTDRTMLEFMADRLESSKVTSSSKTVFKNIFKDVSYWFVLFFAAAICNAKIFEITNQSLAAANKIPVIIGIAILGLTFSSSAGFFLEGFIRKNALNSIFSGIRSSRANKNIWDRVLFIEYINVVEAYAFYAHDLGWILSLLVVSVATTVLTTGLSGLLPVVMMIMILVSLYLLGMPKLSVARNKLMDASEYLMAGLSDLIAMCPAVINRESLFLFETKIRQRCDTRLDAWVNTKINLLMWKSLLAISGQLTVGSLYITIFIIFSRLGAEPSIKALVIGSLFSLDGETVRLFTAFSGYSTQLQAKEVVNSFGNATSNQGTPSFLYKNDEFILREVKVSYLPYHFQQLQLEPGIYRLNAASGSGKTSYLRALSRHNVEHRSDKAIYLQESSIHAIAWFNKSNCVGFPDIYDIVVAEVKNGGRFFILDEALLHIPTDQAILIIEKLESLSRRNSLLIIYTDQRIPHEKTIDLQTILVRTK